MGANLAKGGNAFLDALPGTQVSFFKKTLLNLIFVCCCNLNNRCLFQKLQTFSLVNSRRVLLGIVSSDIASCNVPTYILVRIINKLTCQ